MTNTEEMFQRRMLAYYNRLNGNCMKNGRAKKNLNEFHAVWKKIWICESRTEKYIYGLLKRWEENHPILAIVLCAVFGTILLKIITGILVEASIRFFLK